MSGYITLVDAGLLGARHQFKTVLLRSVKNITTTPHSILKTTFQQHLNDMSFLFPRAAFAPVRCAPVVRQDFAPLFSLFDDTLNEVNRISRQQRRTFNPRFDVKETKEAYSLEGELPGIAQKDLSIEFVDENTLTIKGTTETLKESGTHPSQADVQASKPKNETSAPTNDAESSKFHQPTVEDEESADVAKTTPQSTETFKEVAAAASTQQAVQRDQPQYWVSERSVGSFSRSFNFPSRVNQEAVKASLKNGILSILVPKAAAPESRRINIE